MKQTRLAFLKAKKINDSTSELLDISGMLYSSIDELVDSTREEYAKELYWIKEGFMYDDVETPTDDVSLEEFQTEEGQHKEWNRYLTELIKNKENGTLMEYVPAIDNEPVDAVCYVFEVGGQEVFFWEQPVQHDSNIFNLFEFENVTNEYFSKFIQTINPDEIEEFVATHTQDEVEEKYISRWTREHSDSFSMWEW